MLHSELTRAEAGGSSRLLVALHGLGDSMEGYRWLPPALRLPWLNYLLVNAPDTYYGGFSWYDFASNPGPGVRRSFRALEELMARLEREHPAKETIIFGFSQGALMTMELGARYKHLFRGLIGISGYVHEPGTLIAESSAVARQQRFLITHGTHDPLIPIEPVREQMQLLQKAGFQIEWHELAKEHTIAGETEIDLIRRFIENCFNRPVP